MKFNLKSTLLLITLIISTSVLLVTSCNKSTEEIPESKIQLKQAQIEFSSLDEIFSYFENENNPVDNKIHLTEDLKSTELEYDVNYSKFTLENFEDYKYQLVSTSNDRTVKTSIILEKDPTLPIYRYIGGTCTCSGCSECTASFSGGKCICSGCNDAETNCDKTETISSRSLPSSYSTSSN